MPIRKVPGGYQWGQHGKVYRNRSDAEKQAAAAYAHGYRGENSVQQKKRKPANVIPARRAQIIS